MPFSKSHSSSIRPLINPEERKKQREARPVRFVLGRKE
jgi:hypothetical protein